MKSPSFQLYPQDFISSLDCQMMSLEEFGAYNWLLYHSWIQEPQGYLPNNPEILAKLLRINPRTFAKMWRNTLEKKFKISEDGKFIYNERLLSEAQKQADYREKQSLNGSKGGRPAKSQKPKKAKPNPDLNSGLDLGKAKKSSSSSTSISTSSTTSDNEINNNLFTDVPPDFISKWYRFQEWFTKEKFPNVKKMDKQLTPKELHELYTKYPSTDINTTLENMENNKNLKNYVSVYLTLNNWIKRKYATLPA